MARTTSGGEESKAAKAKAPAKTPARRRTGKARQTASVANDSITAATETMSGSDAGDAPSPAEVQRRAYELYVQRGCSDGYDKDDWYEAERQLRQRH